MKLQPRSTILDGSHDFFTYQKYRLYRNNGSLRGRRTDFFLIWPNESIQFFMGILTVPSLLFILMHWLQKTFPRHVGTFPDVSRPSPTPKTGRKPRKTQFCSKIIFLTVLLILFFINLLEDYMMKKKLIFFY